jgi:glycosidase
MKYLTEIHTILGSLYGETRAKELQERLSVIIERYTSLIPTGTDAGQSVRLTEKDALLITYANQVTERGSPPLETLSRFCKKYLIGAVSGIHILPFFPSSSDDGFSVIDYKEVNPDFGDWRDIERLGEDFRLMFDAVINHISVESTWFKGFLRGDPHYQDTFISVTGNPDLSQVVRPRALPLLTEFQTAAGDQKVWTTFSTDQVDLNYHHPQVLFDIIDVLLFYVSKGAEFIRLDAIAYLWKEIGTSCIHLSQTHAVVQLFRAILDGMGSGVLLITETNVPHADNISYFGDGTNEAHMVYNFALPPVVLHTLHSQNTSILSAWVSELQLPSDQVTFFNFLASHDGIGLNPARGILADAQIDFLIELTQENGGLVSYKTNPDGSESPYELNINYFDALNRPGDTQPLELQVGKFMAAQAIMLTLLGVPGIYFHSLFGSRGWPEGVQITGRNRTINRQKIERTRLERALVNPETRQEMVFAQFQRLLKVRAKTPAFHPLGSQHVLDAGSSIFALARFSPPADNPSGDRSGVLSLQNVSPTRKLAALKHEDLDSLKILGQRRPDLILGEFHNLDSTHPIVLEPFQTLWIDITQTSSFS